MKVYGELEVAQLEGFATVDLPNAATNFRRAVYDTTVNKMKISDGVVWKAAGDVLPMVQYTVGASASSDYTTIALALAAHSSNVSFLLDNSYVAVENLTITGNNIYIIGQGAISVLTGNITINAGVLYTKIQNIKVTGNITFTATAKYNDISNVWISNTTVVTDNGSSNNIYLLRDE